jgi:hypothetical protein
MLTGQLPDCQNHHRHGAGPGCPLDSAE